jgi:hypothetical protein
MGKGRRGKAEGRRGRGKGRRRRAEGGREKAEGGGQEAEGEGDKAYLCRLFRLSISNYLLWFKKTSIVDRYPGSSELL